MKRGCDTNTSFPYAAGFRSLTREIVDAVPLSVRGALPSWLEGALLRTGPSKFEVGTRTYNHWFDGLAMLHRFAFTGGAVTYSNRFLDGDAFRAAEATGKICYSEFATDPCRTLFGRVAAIFDPSSPTIAASTSQATRTRSSHSPSQRCPCAFSPIR